MSLLVFHAENGKSFFQPDQVSEAVRGEWPEARVVRVADTDALFAFEVDLGGPGAPSGVSIARRGTGVAVDGDLGAALAFIAWFRRLVPPDQHLIVSDEAYLVSMPLEPGASAEAIRTALGLPPQGPSAGWSLDARPAAKGGPR